MPCFVEEKPTEAVMEVDDIPSRLDTGDGKEQCVLLLTGFVSCKWSKGSACNYCSNIHFFADCSTSHSEVVQEKRGMSITIVAGNKINTAIYPKLKSI